jgi:hypothetical protein
VAGPVRIAGLLLTEQPAEHVLHRIPPTVTVRTQCENRFASGLFDQCRRLSQVLRRGHRIGDRFDVGQHINANDVCALLGPGERQLLGANRARPGDEGDFARNSFDGLAFPERGVAVRLCTDALATPLLAIKPRQLQLPTSR